MREHWRRAARYSFFGAWLAACGTALPPGAGGDNAGPPGSTGTCASPGTPGCPCDHAGETVSCGKVVETAGNYVTCSMGHATCDGSHWGQCVGHDLVVKSTAATSLSPNGLKLESLTLQCADAGADGGAVNPCDPNPGCSVVIGQPTDVDASNVSVTEGGITLSTDASADGPVAVTCADGGLACSVHYCSNDAGAGTTISGNVYDPAGNVPLYNVIVYVPNDPNGKLTPPPAGVQCTQCASTQTLAASLNAVTATYTDVNGHFTLKNAPDTSGGANPNGIPIVVQSGKWRREIFIRTVNQCGANVVTGAAGTCNAPNGADATACQLHLPRNQYDGYDYVTADGHTWGRADLPQIAIVSGSADPLECILLKAGIDPFEVSSYDKDVGNPAVKHHVHFYQSDQAPGSSLDPAYGTVQKGSALWLDTSAPNNVTPGHYGYYDLVMLPCEGNSLDKEKLYAGAHNAYGDPYYNIIKYANAGGRVFTTHYGYTWLQYPGRSPTAPNGAYVTGPDNWGGMNGVADWTHATGSQNTPDPLTATILAGFNKGAAFQQWLYNVGASTTLGQLTIHQGRQDLTVSPDMAYANASQPWMTAPPVTGTNPFDIHFTFNTPFNAASTTNQCGRVVYSDFHVSASALVGSNNTCAAVTDALGRTTFQGCGFTQQCACGNPATVAACSPTVTGTCNEPCGTSADCADSTYTCTGALQGGCGPALTCITSSCTPVACSKNGNGNWVCPGGGSTRCDRNSHLCVCTDDSACPSGSKCVDNGQCGWNSTCSGTGASDGANCTTPATCNAATCQGNAETCTALATGSCPLAGHVCTAAGQCACAKDSDCPTDGKCLNVSGNCPDPTMCTAPALSAVDNADCTIPMNNVCYSNTECGGVGSVETCTSKGTCTSAGGVACVNGQACGAASCSWNGGGVSCPAAGAKCTGGWGNQVCQCTNDAQCASGKCINTGQCTAVCNGSGAADNGYCTTAGQPTSCTSNTQCVEGGGAQTETCQAGGGTKKCVQSGGSVCHADQDCPGTSVCVPSNGNNWCNFNWGACSGWGQTADAAGCTTTGQPATCSGNGNCVQNGGTQVETCVTVQTCAPVQCTMDSQCPAGHHCNVAMHACQCGNDLDCPGSSQCLTTSPSCTGTPCTGTGTADTAGCVPVPGGVACPNCGASGLETCQASTTPNTCPLAGHACGSAGVCLCAADADCASGKCINSASNCPVAAMCTGTGTGDTASCMPAGTGSSCVTPADCSGGGTSTDPISCSRPKSCSVVTCSGWGSSCPGTSRCNNNSNVCTCHNDADCPSGKCVPSSSNNNCQSWQGNGTCTGTGASDSASCQLAGAPSTCTANAQCGAGETCAAGGATPTLGVCSKTCASSTSCTGHETCSGGTCSGCTTNAQCTSLIAQATCVTQTSNPTTGKCCFPQTPPNGAIPPGAPNAIDLNNCALSSHEFPESCSQAPMTAQEKALEFMFFDITACVQPDTGPPPPPPPPPLTAQTFPLDFTATCGDAGAPPRWRELDFTASFPSPANGASITIKAQTGPVGPGGVLGGDAGAASLVPSTPLAVVTNDQTTGSAQVFLDTSGGYQDAGASTGVLSSASPPVVSQSWLHLLVTLTPTSDGAQSPTFVSWSVVYDCPPTE